MNKADALEAALELIGAMDGVMTNMYEELNHAYTTCDALADLYVLGARGEWPVVYPAHLNDALAAAGRRLGRAPDD